MCLYFSVDIEVRYPNMLIYFLWSFFHKISSKTNHRKWKKQIHNQHKNPKLHCKILTITSARDFVSIPFCEILSNLIHVSILSL